MPRLRGDRKESRVERHTAIDNFRSGHLTGRENKSRGSGRDPSIADRRRTPSADMRAGMRSGERGEDLSKAEAKRFRTSQKRGR